MQEREMVADAIVVQESGKAFRSFIPSTVIEQIGQCGGLTNTPMLTLKETPERPIDPGVMDGTDKIMDILVEMQPGMTINLN